MGEASTGARRAFPSLGEHEPVGVGLQAVAGLLVRRPQLRDAVDRPDVRRDGVCHGARRRVDDGRWVGQPGGAHGADEPLGAGDGHPGVAQDHHGARGARHEAVPAVGALDVEQGRVEARQARRADVCRRAVAPHQVRLRRAAGAGRGGSGRRRRAVPGAGRDRRHRGHGAPGQGAGGGRQRSRRPDAAAAGGRERRRGDVDFR
mmetsp:Transcript_50952/g.157226  ORF Transcript_50952/g.157226 Transcript_50952/m.157226 type:complete len:204 (+) Transcript_50952:41-652(+)